MSPERNNQEKFSFEKASVEFRHRLVEDVELVRDLSRAQASIWKKVPYWALLSEGGVGSSFNQNMAYQDGLWVLRSSKRAGYFQNAIDLDNGEIVQMRDPRQLATQTDVIHIAVNGLEQLDATRILDGLTTDAVQFRRSNDPRSTQELTKWREAMIQKFNIKEVYKRERILTAEDMFYRTAGGLASDMVG